MTGDVRGTLRRHARAASGIVLEKTALCFQLVHPGDRGPQTQPQLYVTDADACRTSGSSYSFSFRLNWSSFNLTNTPASPPLTRWTNSPSFAPKTTLKTEETRFKDAPRVRVCAAEAELSLGLGLSGLDAQFADVDPAAAPPV